MKNIESLVENNSINYMFHTNDSILNSVLGGIKLKNELHTLQDLDEKLESMLFKIKHNPKDTNVDINTIKVAKNTIYEKASKTFLYNLKRLIQIESTQKNLAKKIGISEDLLSKYKSGEAFPSIETLMYICNVYNISIDKLLNTPLTPLDIEKIENNEDTLGNIFEENYYTYFLVTNMIKEGAVHEGIIKLSNNNAVFKILSGETVIKYFTGDYSISGKLVFFNLHSTNDGNAYITMFKPNVNKNKYVGGLAMLMLSSDANSKPCSQKILFSKTRINREVHYKNLKELLSFSIEDKCFGNVKISQIEDEAAYHFIEKLS